MNLNTIILLFVFISCSNQQGSSINKAVNIYTTKMDTLSQNIKEVKFFKKWVFIVDNKDTEKIGYKIYTDDESIGVKAIDIGGEYIYITDVYHNNIKRININTGEIKTSKSLSNKPGDYAGIWLRDIGVFKDKIYAPSDVDIIYIFNKDLQLINSFKTPKGRKDIENINQNGIDFFINSDQLPDKTIEKTILSINENGIITTIKKQIPIEEYTKQQSEKTIQGKPFKTYIKNGRNYFECEYGIVELKTSIPEIKEYDALNINFNSNILVCFGSTPTEFTLYIYKY